VSDTIETKAKKGATEVKKSPLSGVNGRHDLRCPTPGESRDNWSRGRLAWRRRRTSKPGGSSIGARGG